MRQIRSWYSLARLAGELEVAKTWKDEGQSCCTETTSELEHDTQIASQKRNDHSSYDETRGKDEMAVAIEFACEEVGLENLAANKAFERQGGEHVETKKTTSDIDNDVVVWEVVKNIAEGLLFETPVSGYAHCDGGSCSDDGRVVCDLTKLVHRRFLE